MQLRTTTGKRIFLPLFKAFAATVIALSMVAFPQQTFQAAFRGLDAWWSIVFPALLPFFVMSELLIGLGVVNFMGVLLEPVMRPSLTYPEQEHSSLSWAIQAGPLLGPCSQST